MPVRGEDRIAQGRTTGCGTRARGQRFGHQSIGLMVVAEQVADLVGEHREQVDAALLALVAGGGELAVAAWRRIDEPAPAGGVVVEPVCN